MSTTTTGGSGTPIARTSPDSWSRSKQPGTRTCPWGSLLRELVDIARGAERGIPCYLHVHDGRDHDLSSTHAGSRSRTTWKTAPAPTPRDGHDMIRALFAADEQQSFHQFFRLPAEAAQAGVPSTTSPTSRLTSENTHPAPARSDVSPAAARGPARVPPPMRVRSSPSFGGTGTMVSGWVSAESRGDPGAPAPSLYHPDPDTAALWAGLVGRERRAPAGSAVRVRDGVRVA